MTQPNDEEPGREGDEARELRDNSLGRLLTLSDGVFAIAMTLLTFDLKVPAFAHHPSDAALRHALAHQTSTYLSFLVSFYVIASYWTRHRRLMRSVVGYHPRLMRETIFLLFIVAAMPFPANLLGQYGSVPVVLLIYGAFNAAAVLTLMLLNRSVEKFDLLDHQADAAQTVYEKWDTRRDLIVFVLCLPAGYVLGHGGPWVLVLLAVPIRVPFLERRKKRRQLARA